MNGTGELVRGCTSKGFPSGKREPWAVAMWMREQKRQTHQSFHRVLGPS